MCHTHLSEPPQPTIDTVKANSEKLDKNKADKPVKTQFTAEQVLDNIEQLKSKFEAKSAKIAPPPEVSDAIKESSEKTENIVTLEEYINAVSAKKCVTMNFRVANKMICFLVDSGASVSAIDEKTYLSLARQSPSCALAPQRCEAPAKINWL